MNSRHCLLITRGQPKSHIVNACVCSVAVVLFYNTTGSILVPWQASPLIVRVCVSLCLPQVFDSAEYFFQNVHNFEQPNYVATVDDMLRCRARTSGAPLHCTGTALLVGNRSSFWRQQLSKPWQPRLSNARKRVWVDRSPLFELYLSTFST